MPARLTQQVADAFLPHPPDVIGVAVSGGGDSMALLHLLHQFCTLHCCKLRAVTVNHGLRAEAADEAKMVAAQCARLGILHDTLLWDDWDGQHNLQNAAREARYSLMASWARDNDITTIALAHTAEDQAETFLMRLARRSGVDGLSGMQARRHNEGIIWVRPLLNANRATLREYLLQDQVNWVEDPSNEDLNFDRIKARKALELLAPLGIDVAGLAEVAWNMEKARQALDWQAFLAARDMVTVDAGAVVIDEQKMRLLPDEISRRIFVKSFGWISGSQYAPRRGAVANLISALRKGQAGTADGCHARRVGRNIWIFRELNAVRDTQSSMDMLWDERWRLSTSQEPDDASALTIRALGQKGLEQCPEWRASGRPHPVLLSTPAVWSGETVVAAPLAGLHQNWHAEIDGGEDTFFAALLTH